MDRINVAGAMLFFGGTEFMLLMLIAESVYKNYIISQKYISDLGVGPTAPIFNASIIIFGLLVMASSIALYSRWRAFSVIAFIAGLGALGVGIFPEGSPYGLHTLFSLIAFLFGGVAATSSALILKGPLKATAALGPVSLVSLVLYVGGNYAGLGPGGMERLIVYPILIWLIGFGAVLLGS